MGPASVRMGWKNGTWVITIDNTLFKLSHTIQLKAKLQMKKEQIKTGIATKIRYNKRRTNTNLQDWSKYDRSN